MKREILENLLPIKPSHIFWERFDLYPIELIPISKKERDSCILEIYKKLFDENIVKSGPDRQKDWLKGWGENLDNYSKSCNPKDLIPKYFNKYKYIRFDSDFYKFKNSETELNTVRILINYIADIYLKESSQIIELGAGTCHHLYELSKTLNKETNFYALDWSESTTKIANKLKENNHIKNINSFKFDFFNPKWDPNIRIPKSNQSIVYSFAALEQIGTNFDKLYNFITEIIKPKYVVHLEPIGELLPNNELLPFLSKQYFSRRNYLNGYLDFLRSEEKKGEIVIEKQSRMPFGSLFIEGYSLVVWHLQKK
ncbi:hypothetical protein B0W81_02340 [Prochlorococcus sp. HOT_208_60]|nr:hypothetical protein B0W81_02340 [Prochlorococcus sp. HOT_208_60]